MSNAAQIIPYASDFPPLILPDVRNSRRSNYVFDQEYLDRLTEGDPDAEAHFTAYFGQLLLIKLRGRLRCPQQVADARQETFVRVLNALRRKGTILHPERLGGFVNSVCEHVLLESFRSGKRAMQMPKTLDPIDQTSSVESELITEERKRLVKETLGRLSEEDQTLLRGVFLEERDRDELCGELRIDRNYLRVRVHRALTRFRSCFFEEGQRSTCSAGGAS